MVQVVDRMPKGNYCWIPGNNKGNIISGSLCNEIWNLCDLDICHVMELCCGSGGYTQNRIFAGKSRKQCCDTVFREIG